MQDQIQYLPFSKINVNDIFFDSLRADYSDFNSWFAKKSAGIEKAYVQTIGDRVTGFLYLKDEECPVTDVFPIIEGNRALKMGTLKIDSHGTRLGERFIKKSVDTALHSECDKIYVTIFKKHIKLINMFKKYGFYLHGEKIKGEDIEQVYVKDILIDNSDIFKNYPKITTKGNSKFLLSVYPQFHTKLFPDSKLKNEKIDILKDVSHTNSIEKIYICKMKQVQNVHKGDLIYIYRTKEKGSKIPAKYASVLTSICTVEDVVNMDRFKTFEELKSYCKNYSVFDNDTLKSMFKYKQEYFLIRMLYNIALPKRITRGELIEKTDLTEHVYWGFTELDDTMIEEIGKLGEINECYIIN